MDSKPHDVQPIIKTDHRILTLDLFIDEIFINKNNKQTRQLPSKVIYCYDEMQAIDGDWTWEKFNDHIENHLDDPCISLTVDKIRDETIAGAVNCEKDLSHFPEWVSIGYQSAYPIDKSELLVRYKYRGHRSKLKSHEPVTLKFGSNSIFIIPFSPRSSIRILGIYFDERNTFQLTVKKINDEINELRQKYARKRLTDKHMIYIFNSVIIPKIEYWSQFIFVVLPDEKHNQTFGIKVREVLPDKKYNRTFGIKYCQMKVLPDKKHDRTFGIKIREVLPDEKHDQIFGIKVREGVLPDEKHDRTFGIKGREVLPDEKHDRTFGIKVREMLPDEKYDWTFGIKCCQMKSMTRLLELRHDLTFGIKCCQTKMLPDEKHDWTFGIKYCQTKSMTGLLELSVARRKT
ncbi:hypothetical protein RclHR1_13390004 [Rhizophagus clarus]|uniref:Uncharacterized protein n=1 Tax=Rhizophagus clarus TaxID=94130 RepID=A0A2Z6QEC1_9GLOM|nr:hypothetical protein RclHR1_13390004 [Rhizophagus clarus]